MAFLMFAAEAECFGLIERIDALCIAITDERRMC